MYLLYHAEAYSRKNPHPLTDGKLEILVGGELRALEIQTGEGRVLWAWKSGLEGDLAFQEIQEGGFQNVLPSVGWGGGGFFFGMTHCYSPLDRKVAYCW